MLVNAEVSQWGNGLAVRLNKTIIETASLAKGSKVTIEVDKDGIHIRPVKPKKLGFKFPVSEAALLAKMMPELAHADELAEPLAAEIGDQ